MPRIPIRLCPAVALALAALASPASAILLRHDRTDRQAIELAAAKQLPEVGHLGGVGCTLIRPDWVITAAHVLEGVSPFTDHVVLFGGVSHTVTRVVFHPRRVPDTVDPEHDLALLQLDRPVKGVAPAPLWEAGDERGRTVLLAGRGRIGTGLTGPVGDRVQVLRAAMNVVDSVSAGAIFYRFDAPPDGLDLEGIGGRGDSGSPAFIEQDGRRWLAGVTCMNDGGGHGTGRYGSTSGAVRMSTRRGWIDSTIAAPSRSSRDWGPVVRVTDDRAWPATPAGAMAQAFLAAWNTGTPEALTRFIADRLTPRPGRTPEERARAMHELVAQYGRYEPWALRDGGPQRIALLVRTAVEPGWRSVVLTLDPADPSRMPGSGLMMMDDRAPDAAR